VVGFFWQAGLAVPCVVWGVVAGFCLYVENFTVDASIFVVFDKLLRAVGGCLGTKSR
jgi:hypothetical protein